MNTKGHELLIARLYDAFDKVSKSGQQVVTSFLTPAEQQILEMIAKSNPSIQYHLSGGYPMAERQAGIISDGFDEFDKDGSVIIQDFGSQIVCLKSDTDSYLKPLKHPDVLGALMKSGIKRESFGDILCEDHRIFLFCKQNMADFISSEIVRIGKQLVHFELAEINELPEIKRERIEINVPSLRFDAIVAALSKTSRSKAEGMIKQGFVKINDIVLDHKGQLCNNDIVSIRRCGRFLFLGIKNTTRKERLVLEFLKYS